MKTIREIALELGVSKQAVQKRISREPLYTCIQPCLFIEKGTKYIDETGENLIIQAFSSNTTIDTDNHVHIDIADNQQPNVYSDIIQLLQENLKLLQGQLAEKDKQIETLSTALTAAQQTTAAAQALHAGTIKQLEDGQFIDGEPSPPSVPARRKILGIFSRKGS